jgi:hypothetical protein
MSFLADPGQPASNIDLFATGGLSLKAVEETKVATQKLVDAAKSGGFKISAEGVKPMRDALLQVRNKLEGLTAERATLDLAPKLGDHAYGHAVAAHDQKGASQDANSASQVLDQLNQLIIQADEALARAAGIYNENEHRTDDTVKGIRV